MTPIAPIVPPATLGAGAAPIQDGFATNGAEWQVAPDAGAAQRGTVAGSDFGQLLANQIGQLSALQADASQQAQALATGTASDISSSVMAVERAQLAMQLAAQVRTKVTEALQDVFHTQI